MSFCLEHSKTHSTNPSLSKPIIPVVSPPSAPNSDIIYRVTVRQFPPKESFSKRVNLESRKGTKAEPEAKALIQFPKANRDRLILAPSKSRIPLLCVWDARSEPAKSIKDNFPKVEASRSRRSTRTWKTAWEREEVMFIAVGSVVRRRLPSCSNFMTSSTDWACHWQLVNRTEHW